MNNMYHGASKDKARKVAKQSAVEFVNGSYHFEAITIPIKPLCLTLKMQKYCIIFSMRFFD